MKHSYSFCVFNRNLGSNREDATLEERAEQILYYSPESTDTLEMVSADVRTIEAIQAFIDLAALFPNFGQTNSIHSVRLSDMRYAILEVENGIYFVLGISPIEEQNESSFLRFFSTTDDTSQHQMPNEDAMYAILKRIWVLIGPLLGTRLVESPDFSRRFFQHFVPRLFQMAPFNKSPMSCACTTAIASECIEVFDSIMTPDEYIRAVKFVESIKTTSSCFVDKSIVFLREGTVVYSQLSPEDTRTIAMLINFAFPAEAWNDKGVALLGHMMILESERQSSYNDSRAKAIRIRLKGYKQPLRIAALRGGNGNCLTILLRDGEDSEEEEKFISKALSEFQIAASLLGTLRFSGSVQDFPRNLLQSSRFSGIDDGSMIGSHRESMKAKLDAIDATGFFTADLNQSIIVANEKFAEFVGKPRLLPEIIASKALPRNLTVALDAAWSQLSKVNHFATAVICDGDWCVTGIKSKGKVYFRINPISSSGLLMSFSSTEVYKRIPNALNRMEFDLSILLNRYTSMNYSSA